MRFTIGRYPAPRYGHNTGTMTAATGPVRVIVSKGVADHDAFTKLATGYELTPTFRIKATSKVIEISISRAEREAHAEYLNTGEIISEAA